MQHAFSFPGRTMLLPDIVRAENCFLFDAHGNRYLDLESGVWCAGIGHANPAVNQAVSRQMNDLSHVGFCYASPVVERSAALILDLLDHQGGRCTFLCSGSEAVEYGIRIVRSVTRAQKIMTMEDSYLGAYGEGYGRNPEAWFLFDWSACDDCDRGTCDHSCPRWAAIPFEDIGALVFEPGSSSGLVRFPPSRLIRRLAEAISARGGLVMVNEVTTGMGRTGKWFGFQHYDIRPDIVALGKGLGNGYPVSATSINRGLAELLGGEPIAYGQSHFNDPLGAAVAEAVITAIRDEELIARAASLSTMLMARLQDIASRSELVEGVRGRGLMAIVVLTEQAGVATAEELHRQLVRKGFIVDHRPGTRALRMDPALTIDEQDLGRFLDALEQFLMSMPSEGFVEST